jgi:hypothetical protein
MNRLFSTLVLGMALGYCMFFVRLEGRTVAAHLGDIWASSVVQDKVRLVEREVPKALRGTLAEGVPSQAPKRPPLSPHGSPSHLRSRPTPSIKSATKAAVPSPAAADSDETAAEAQRRADRLELDALVQRAQGHRKGARPAP